MGQPKSVVSELEHLTDATAISIFSVSFVTTFGVQVISPALPAIAATFNVSQAQIGLIMTLYTLPGILTVTLSGILADMYGRRVVLLPAFLLTCLFGLGMTFAESYSTLLLLRMAQGIVSAGIMPLLTTVLGDLYSGPVGTTVQGIRLGFNGVSAIIVPAVAGALAGLQWNYPFLIYLVGIPVVIATYYWAPETGKRSANIDFLSELRGYGKSIVLAFSDSTISVLVGGGFFRGFGIYALLTFLPLFVSHKFGATSLAVGMILALRGVSRFISPFVGRILSHFTRKQGFLFGLSLMTIGTFSIPFAPSIIIVSLSFGIYGLGDAILLPLHRDSVATFSREDRRAGVVSAASLLRKIGTTFSPVLFGVIVAGKGYELVFLLTACTFGVYGLAITAFFHPARIE